MSISSALSNAMSGLRVASRGTELVSTNIANALTPGYARRVLNISPATSGTLGGVRMDGITRVVDATLLADKRLAEADLANADQQTQFFSRLETALGSVGDSGSLSGRLAALESSLLTAASRPDAVERLTTVAYDAAAVAVALNDTADTIERIRTEADHRIDAEVNSLNTALQEVVNLNAQILRSRSQGGDFSALEDLRQQVVDQIATIVPIRELPRADGKIALYTTGGAVLVDGTAAEIGFTRSNIVTPYMSLAGATLSGLTLNGQPIRSDDSNGPLRGGSLGAQFHIRDVLAPDAQTEIDALARDLIARFQDPAVDPTLGATDPGLFTDQGAFFDPVNELGIANRLTLNALVDPSQGGASWRLRDGINAAAPGDVGNATLLTNLREALSSNRTIASGSFAGGSFGAAGLLSSFLSDVVVNHSRREQSQSFVAARVTELTEQQLAQGVDTDAEIQNLLQLEQNYAANARVIQTIEEMMNEIIRI